MSCKGEGGRRSEASQGAGERHETEAFTLRDILDAGELIAGTLSGPETYYTFRDRGFGLHYELAEDFASSLGVRLRVEVARDTAELMRWLESGEVDLLALPLPSSDSTLSCRNGWLVRVPSTELARAVDEWYSPGLLASLKAKTAQRKAAPPVRRKARPQMLNAGKGVISAYDALFQRYAQRIGWDWRLLAAQCYQESAFDPRAVSWAGARGLMQIMPSTGERLGLDDPWDAEQSIAAATRYIAQLEARFNDIPDRRERIRFVLAAYNGGAGHVRDAMALARERGSDPKRWGEVEPYVLLLQRPEYYTKPCVRYGYMVGSETASYVSGIEARWRQYCGHASAHVAPRQSSRHESKVRPRDAFLLDSL
ncbi:MAG: transglycosylase SLT domain-containing protein [Prevotellaceae bacterium]|nr:transglycosylase SLT domain-containing protein [Prevotellaceae bacterium]